MQKNIKIRKKKGFTIIESIVYIFLTTLVLLEGIRCMTNFYKGYIESKNISITYDKMQTFYLNLDSILKEDQKENIEVHDNYLLIYRDIESELKSKMIIKEKDSLVVKYFEGENPKGKNTLLLNISDFKVIEKENLIYTVIVDKDGKEFIRCL
ncbi:hypothetical protein [Clostridium weizhouense]|uniref:Uncharacterized protein n=1 Tax=Clostridium weizhouense TaxID=2859781 RepID=A0ABS7AQI4_9CLOT|nr:hypothetical protein [Clostridium weizhouense]MBW6410930.1 hypothetical protein [Clostridium weizhouense]